MINAMLPPRIDEKTKYYITGMFPYPSGAGMHAGHFMEHSIVDAVARYRRSRGYNVMYPMGWDSFGLPAENYAIKTGKSPQETTVTNIASFKNQLTRVGASIDWNREINTTDPGYYKWTQWIFTQLFERGLAYQKEASQWWCPKDKTVLANEQVVNGRCWRCDSIVVKKPMKQWFFKITEYADALLEEIPALNWPEKIKTAQENWIGRSEGIVYKNKIRDSDLEIESFSAHFEAFTANTFVVIAPDHPFLPQLVAGLDDANDILEKAKAMVIARDAKGPEGLAELEGIFTGRYAVDTFDGEDLPIWIANYALADYGTGIVLCSAHDERDFEFAKKYGIRLKATMVPVDPVEAEKVKNLEYCFYDMADGMLIEPKAFAGKIAGSHRQQIMDYMVHEGYATSQVAYKMRDWLISRQRYWGAPIPIVHCPEHGAVAVPERDLPVILPEVKDYEPKGDGKSPLARQTDWVNTSCPTCGGPAKRETDVMDGYACSSWYLLRYTDPHNDTQAWSPHLAGYWTPLDMYVGGDHAVAHLLYVRFWNHVFYDMGLVPTKEPVSTLVYHGLIQAEDGRKMSKSLGNVVDPLEVIDAGYGADALRTFELFLGPINENSNWSSRGIAGVYRFINRVWTLTQEYIEASGRAPTSMPHDSRVESLVHATTKKVTQDIERLSFNTAIASLMECVNELYKLKVDGLSTSWQPALETLLQLLQPFAPHMTAELWQELSNDTALDFVPWPSWDDTKLHVDTVTIAVQVNGKLRGTIEVIKDTPEAAIIDQAKTLESVARHITADIVKVIYVKDKLVNIVSQNR
jgi:leucyl-tRNA synthetase